MGIIKVLFFIGLLLNIAGIIYIIVKVIGLFIWQIKYAIKLDSENNSGIKEISKTLLYWIIVPVFGIIVYFILPLIPEFVSILLWSSGHPGAALLGTLIAIIVLTSFIAKNT